MWELLREAVPLAVYWALFLLMILRENIGDVAVTSMSLVAVIAGLMIFEMLGFSLPAKAGLMAVLVVVFLLGFA